MGSFRVVFMEVSSSSQTRGPRGRKLLDLGSPEMRIRELGHAGGVTNHDARTSAEKRREETTAVLGRCRVERSWRMEEEERRPRRGGPRAGASVGRPGTRGSRGPAPGARSCDESGQLQGQTPGFRNAEMTPDSSGEAWAVRCGGGGRRGRESAGCGRGRSREEAGSQRRRGRACQADS
ncbi:hypothetical protein HJG60_009432 [Phyllostomus discolor]|uniref:Uncharacterized protein n=1 Tax=Phyllostomus discolor TaxID=89673 RepID=A0A833YJ38_9CHIR|nr:hypothetical protein HJG60_009432 [Phyllostomus discolor]